MTVHSDVIDHPLAEISGNQLLQLEPYPVAAPRTLEAVCSVIHFARGAGMKVLPLGTGSSFDASFSLMRGDVLALMLSGYRGIEQMAEQRVRVRAGTELRQLLGREPDGMRQTVGGMLCDGRSHESSTLRLALAARIISLQVVNSSGEILNLRCGSWGSCRDRGLGGLVCGSGGRLGVVTAVELSWNGEHRLLDAHWSGPREQTMAAHRDACLTRADLLSLFDAHALFQW